MNDRYLAWAQAALAHYPLRAPTVRFLGHSDNITFRVEEAGGEVYLLRLHRPALQYWSGIRQLPEFIRSELTWLEALEMGGFPVQRPIHTLDSQLVASLDFDGSGLIPVTLLSWLQGEHFSPAAPEAIGQVERFGALVARLHDFSTRWSPPPGFARPTYDADHFKHIFAHLLRGVDSGIFPEEVYWILRATSQSILSEISAFPMMPETWGMIHADLHVGNFLINGDTIIPIDFSFCGFGHYLYDLSVCLSGGLSAALRPAFLQGYRSIRPLPENSFRLVEAYALSGILGYFASQVDHPGERAWLQRRLPELARNECSRFLRGESIYR